MVVIIKECVKLNWCSPSLIVSVIMLTPLPHNVGVDILFYCCWRPLWASHQLLRDPPAPIVLGGMFFCSPGPCLFICAMTLSFGLKVKL